RIPYKIVKSSEAALENAPDHSEKKLTGKNILVVEDNDINQKVILNTLKSWDASCTVVPTAVEGFDMLMKEHFDLILMDIELPVINGWDASQYIRMKFEAPAKTIPIIALTAYASEDDKQKCYSSGMNDVVTKPFNNDELFFKIYNLVYSQSLPGDYIGQGKAKQHEGPFEKFERKYADDAAGLKEIYEMYITELPGYVQELKQFRDAGDAKQIKRQVHKMKSPLGLLADEDLISLLNRLQTTEVLDNEALRNEYISKLIGATETIQEEIAGRLKKS
ncbi:MAG: response regulator, partial [Bacteroidia bacterium]